MQHSYEVGGSTEGVVEGQPTVVGCEGQPTVQKWVQCSIHMKWVHRRQ